MADKIVIAELDVDTTALLEAQAELGQAILSSKNNMKEFEKANKDSLATDKNLAKQYELMKADLKNLNSEYSTNSKNLAEARKGEIDLNVALEKNVTTIKQASQNNKELKEIRDKIDSSTVEGAKKIADINSKLDKNTELIKENVSSNEQNKIAVGGYTDGIVKAAEKLGLQGTSLKIVTSLTNKLKASTEAQTVAQEGATVATGRGTGAMKIFKLALASTGIGLIVIALGSLIAYFKGTQQGAEKMRVITSALGAVMGKVTDIFINLGDAMMSAFEDPQKAVAKLWEMIKTNIMNRIIGIKDSFVALGKIISASLSFDWEEAGKQSVKFASAIQESLSGIKTDDLVNGIKEFSKEAKKAAGDAMALQKRENKVIEKRRSWLVGEKLLLAEIADLKLKAEDLSLSNKEREETLNKAIAKRAEITRVNNKLAQEEYDIQVARNGLSSSGEADLDKEAELLARLNDVRKEGADGMTELFTKKQAISITQRALDVAEAQKKKQDIVDNYSFELAKFKELNNGKKELSIEQLLYEKELNDKKTELLEAQKDAGLVSENDYYLQKLQLSREFEEANAEIIEGIKATAKEKQDAIDAENWEISLMEEASEYERQRMIAEKEYQEAISDAEKKGTSTTLIEKKYSKKKEEIARAEASAKLMLASQITSGLTELLGQESLLGKATAIATATINTYLGATRALAEGGPFLGPILAGVTIANGLAMVAKMSGISPKFEKGGSFEIGGKRHSSGGTIFQGSDGTRFEAEKGEQLIIMNRGASQEYRNNLSAMNVRHGGRSLVASRAKSNYFENGGVVTASVDNSDIVNAIANMQIVVQVTDIANGLATQAKVVNNNTF